MAASLKGERPRWVWRALAAFTLWFGLLCLMLAFEHGAPGRWVFSSEARTRVYLAVQIALLLAALGGSAITLVRGPNRDRAIVFLPTVILVLYGLMLVSGGG